MNDVVVSHSQSAVYAFMEEALKVNNLIGAQVVVNKWEGSLNDHSWWSNEGDAWKRLWTMRTALLPWFLLQVQERRMKGKSPTLLQKEKEARRFKVTMGDSGRVYFSKLFPSLEEAEKWSTLVLTKSGNSDLKATIRDTVRATSRVITKAVVAEKAKPAKIIRR